MAQPSVNLDPYRDQEIYQKLERLIAFGLIPEAIQSQKPWSTFEALKFTQSAQKNLNTLENTSNSQNLNTIKKDLIELTDSLTQKISPGVAQKKTWFSFHPHSFSFQTSYLDSPDVAFPKSNGIGTLDATFNPLVQNRNGQNFKDGGQYNWQFNHSVQVTPYMIYWGDYQFESFFPQNSQENARFFLNQGYAQWQFKNIRLEIGRDTLTYGQGEFGGLLLTNNARGLDQLSLSNDSPFLLPGFLKHLGYINTHAFVAYLGEDHYFPHGFLMGYQVNLKSFSVWEWGLSNIVMMGGEGSPSSGFGRTIGDYVGFSGTDKSSSNRIISLNSALTLPFLRHSRIYGEMAFDDKSIEDLEKTFLDSSAYSLGLFVPRLNTQGTLQWRFEGTYTSQLIYRHWQYRSGMTLKDHLLGDPLGPDGFRLMNVIYWLPSTPLSGSWHTTFEGRDSNTYINGEERHSLTTDRPTDKRLRNSVELSYDFSSQIKNTFWLGHEHVFDFAFQNNSHENNYFLGWDFNFKFAR